MRDMATPTDPQQRPGPYQSSHSRQGADMRDMATPD
jgi:hypothetical protein